MNEWFKEASIAMLMLVYFLFLMIIPIMSYGAGHSDGFSEGYQKCLVDFKHKDKE